MTDATKPVSGRPETALAREDVRAGDRIISYSSDGSQPVQRYQIVAPPQDEDRVTEDSRGDLLMWVLNLDTGVTSQVDTATLGLTCSPDGARTRWAIPYDDE